MERWLPTALAALALALGAWNAWSIALLTAEIDQAALVEVAAVSSSAGADSDAKPSRWASERKPRYPDDARPERVLPDDDDATEATSADDPVFREKVASVLQAEEERRDAERRARFEESIRTEVQGFADEEGLDEATTTALFVQLDERTEAFRAIRDDVRNGTISWSDGRAEMEDLRTTGDADLERLLGAERAERLQTRLWGDRGGDRGGWGPR